MGWYRACVTSYTTVMARVAYIKTMVMLNSL